MKLLQVTTVPSTLESFLTPFAIYFRSQGWVVDAAANGLVQSRICREAFDHCFEIPFSRKVLKNSIRQISHQIRSIVYQNEYDIVHVHTPIAAFLTRFALRKQISSRPAVVYTAHGFHFGFSNRPVWYSPYFYLEKIAGSWTDALVLINRRDYCTSINYRLIRKDLVYHIPGIGVDLRQYSSQAPEVQSPQELRSELGISDSDFMLLMIAEFNPGKRHRDLLAALKELENNRIHAVFAGDGLLFSEVQALALRLGLQENVHFLGFRTDIRALISASDAAILPSEREGLPKSIMECMAMGTVVLGTQTRGIAELLNDDCGILFEVGNISQIAEKISLAFNDRLLLQRCAANAKEKIRNYDLDLVLRKYEEIYATVIRRARGLVARGVQQIPSLPTGVK